MTSMSGTDRLKALIELWSPAWDASLDSYCVVNAQNEIVHADLTMRSFLGIKGKRIPEKLIFCDLLKLAACSDQCKILGAIKSGQPLNLGEAPAQLREEKLRLMLKATPLSDPQSPGQAPIGAVIFVRNTTQDVVLVAKYGKTQRLIEEKDQVIATRDAEIESIRNRLESLKQAFDGLAVRLKG